MLKIAEIQAKMPFIMIHLRFSPAYDSAVFTGLPTDTLASVGMRALGRAGLLDFLEVQLGIKGPDVAPERRRLTYLDAVRSAGPGFWSGSYAVDPISAAERLLQVRDLLVESGWSGAGISGIEKTSGFSKIEQVFKDSSGLPDRLRVVAGLLAEVPSACGISQITLECPESSIHGAWRRIFDSLSKAGVKIERHRFEETPPASKACDLALLNSLTSTPKLPAGDGSFRIITARDPWESARMAAAFVAALSLQDRSKMVLICPPRNRGILRTAFLARGIPFGGSHSEVSYARPSLQLLILALTLAWDPKDPTAALALLTLEGSPVHSRFRYALLRSFEKSLAVGGSVWSEALEAEVQSALSEATTQEEREKIQKRASRVQEWFSGKSYPVEAGVPRDEVLAICKRVSQWLRVRSFGGDLSSGRETIEMAGLLIELVLKLNEPTLTRERLFQLMLEVLGSGVTGGANSAEALGPIVIDSPAQLAAQVVRVLWWDFTGANAGSSPDSFFSESEAQNLQKEGVDWPDFKARTKEEGGIGHRVFRLCEKQVVLFHALLDEAGDPEVVHPLIPELLPQKIRSEWLSKTQVRLTEMEHPLVHEFLDSIGAKEVARLADPLTKPRIEWKVPPGILKLRAEESASSLEKALGCELAWVLSYSARLRGEDRDTLKYEDRTRGLIAHEVIAKVFAKGEVPDPVRAREAAGKVYDQVILDLAPTLLKSTHANERFGLRVRILDAVETYASFLSRNGFTIVGTEVEVKRSDRTLAGVHLTGAIDHVLKDRSGLSVIVDHKWGKAKYKREALESGTSLQLALYSLLISGGTEPILAYHMIQDRDVMTLNQDYSGAKRVEGPDGREVVKRAAAGIEGAKAVLQSGVLIARGLLKEDQERHFEAPCRYCDFDKICGKFFQEEA